MKNELTQTLNWDIQVEPIVISDQVSKTRNALVRSDNRELMGIVSKEYCPLSNQRLMNLVDSITATGLFKLRGYDEFNGGKTVVAFLQNINPLLKLNSFPMQEYLIIGNSHDGTRPFYVGTGCTLIRCMNQFYSTLKVYQQKHTSEIEFELEEVNVIIANYKKSKNLLYDSFDGMDSVKVTEDTVERLIREIHMMLVKDNPRSFQEVFGQSPSMKSLRKSIYKEMGELGNNAFGLFNGVTWYTTHEMRNAGRDFGKNSGTANIINQKAFRFCSNLKRNAGHLFSTRELTHEDKPNYSRNLFNISY